MTTRLTLTLTLLLVTAVIACALLPLGGDVSTDLLPVLRWQLRAPRAAMAALVGAALACSGLTMQTVFRNPLAAPDLLGVSSGAALGAVLAMVAGLTAALAQTCAVGAGLATLMLAQAVGRRWRGIEPTLGLVLAGVALASAAGAAIALLLTFADPYRELPALTFWLMGSFVGVGWEAVGRMALALGVVLLILGRLARRADALALSDDEVRSLGENPIRLGHWLIGAAALATAVSVALAGVIGWVGLLVPHAARRLVGARLRAALPASALLGGALMVLLDTATRLLSPYELAPGVVTSLLGAPVLLFVTRAQARADHRHG